MSYLVERPQTAQDVARHYAAGLPLPPPPPEVLNGLADIGLGGALLIAGLIMGGFMLLLKTTEGKVRVVRGNRGRR